MSWVPNRFSSCDTIWLAADCDSPFSAAAREKLWQRATSQNTFSASSCIGVSLSLHLLIARDNLMKKIYKWSGCSPSQQFPPIGVEQARNRTSAPGFDPCADAPQRIC